MLGKLFVHEWKATWKLMAIMNAAVLVLSGIGALFFHRNAETIKPFFDSMESTGGETLYFLACMCYLILLVFSIAVLAVGGMLYFYIRFYRNLYTDQGYLMHTLPVNEHQLIMSKTLVCLLWRIISALVVTAGVLTLVFSVFGDEINMDDIYEMVREAVDYFGGVRTVILLVLGILSMLAKALFSTFTGYTCISIGQLASKNKVLAAVGVYFGMRVLFQMVGTFGSQYMVILDTITPYSFIELLAENENTVLIGMFVMVVVSYLLCLAMYSIIHSIMHKRLNLD